MIPPELRRPIALSILAAVLTIGLKTAAYLVTGSVGLFSDALESGVNLLAAVTAYLSLWYAARPADPNHAFGHQKIEFFSSGLEGVLVLVAGAGTAWYGVSRLLHPQPLLQLELGAALAVAASVINFVVARLLLRAGRRHRSIVLEADGHHLMSDVYTSAGVVAGVALVAVTGWQVLDPLVALAVGGSILWTGVGLVHRSFNGLMDHALPADEQDAIRAAIRAHLPAGADFHGLRTRQAGTRRFVEFHLLVDGDLSVRAAHHAAHAVEAGLTAAVPGLEVLIHVEPVDESGSWEPEYLAQLGEPAGPAEGAAVAAAGGGGTLAMEPPAVPKAATTDPGPDTLPATRPPRSAAAEDKLRRLIAEQGVAATATYERLLGSGRHVWASDEEFEAFMAALAATRAKG